MQRTSFSFRRTSLLAGFMACIALASPFAPAARADEAATRIRNVLNQHGDAIVTVSLVLKSAVMDDRAELETQGVVVDPSGLVVVTNMAIDPGSSLSRSIRGSSYSSSVVSARYLLGDGSEISARLVLRDVDRNLAFLRPVNPLKKKLTHIDFKGAASGAQLADPVWLVGRLGKAGARNISATQERLTAVLQKPRKAYGLPFFGLMNLGQAVFTERGDFLGLVSVRSSKGGSNSVSMNPSDNMMATVIPAEDVWEIAAQAPMHGPRPAAAPAKGASGKGAPRKGAAAKTAPRKSTGSKVTAPTRKR